jgi:hypothetical protein
VNVPNFPGSLPVQPPNIATGEDILASHVGPHWEETIAIATMVLSNESRITTNEGDITTLQGDFGNLQTQVNNLGPGDVGLGNVDNTSDADKPVSTATQTALNLKQDLSEKGVALGYASLDGAGRIPSTQLPISALEYLGTWDATTNTPVLDDVTGSTGDMYRVTVAGTQDLGSGPIDFAVGDYAIHNGTVWEKADTTDAVSSVAGKTGAVLLDHNDITDFDAETQALINATSISSLAAPTGDVSWGSFGIVDLTQITIGGVGNVLQVKDSLADANARWLVRGADGVHQWGTGGGSATDTQLQRATGGILSILGIGTAAGIGGLQVFNSYQKNIKLSDNATSTDQATLELDGITNNPFLKLGPLAGPLDWTLQRTAAGVATITGSILLTGSAQLGDDAADLVGFHGVQVAQAAHIADPAGGGTQDAEARTAINAILVALENKGITASV